MVGDERFTLKAERIGCQVQVSMRDGLVTAVKLTRASPPDTPVSHEGARVREMLRKHFETGEENLTQILVDLDAMPPFWRSALEALRQVPPGEIVTYGQLAVLAGRPGASRAVGGAMRNNPIPIIVPCHRVVAANGKLGNYSGVGSTDTKRRLLELEHAPGYS